MPYPKSDYHISGELGIVKYHGLKNDGMIIVKNCVYKVLTGVNVFDLLTHS